MNDFFDTFEADVCLQFKIHTLDKKEEVMELLRVETEQKQAKLEADALKEYEAKQRENEAKAAEEAKKAPAGKAPAKAPAKGKGGDQKPALDVPKLEVPQVTDFKSEMGNQYIRER